MANIDVPITQVTKDGIRVASPVVTASGSTYFIRDNDGNVLLQVVNGTGTASWVDIVPTLSAAGYALGNHRVTIPMSATTWVGPIPPFVFSADVEIRPNAAVALSLSGLRI